jgi:AcrR family transcriptional regulator
MGPGKVRPTLEALRGKAKGGGPLSLLAELTGSPSRPKISAFGDSPKGRSRRGEVQGTMPDQTPPSSAKAPNPAKALSPKAIATRDAILEATAALLPELGFEGVNTNIVAARAGVTPPAVYRYFPNKFSLYLALADKLQGELDVDLDRALVGAGDKSIAVLVDALVDVGDAFWQRRPAFGPLWMGGWAMQGEVAPAFLFGQRTVARLQAATDRFRRLGPLQELVTLGIAINITMAILNIAQQSPPEFRPLLVAEAKRATLAYLDAA